MNEIEVVVGAQETASDVIEGIGDSAVRTERVIVQSMGDAEDAFDSAARGSSRLGEALDRTEGGVGTAADALGGLGDVTQNVSDLMNTADRRAADLARAQTDVAQAAQDAQQAVEDLNQAHRDSAQATIDAEQAHIDQTQALIDEKTAQEEYNKLVKEGKGNTAEAQQALNDIKQAKLDGKQATADLAQAERDGKQATLDANQAMIDQKAAANDLTDANRELESQSGTMSLVSEYAGLLSGILGGLTGIIGGVTAVQWAWNAAMAANPIGLVVAGIVILIGIIVLIATKTTWFQQLWKVIWDSIGDPVKAAWEWIKKTTSSFVDWMKKVPGAIGRAFDKVSDFITAPFKAAFNAVARYWNSTIGGFGFSIPSWVPGALGGQSFTIPNMPQLAVGGDVLKSGLAYIHQGERIYPKAQAQRLPYDMAERNRNGWAAKASAANNVVLEVDVSRARDAFERALLELLRDNVRVRNTIDTGIRKTVHNNGNGSVQTAYGKRGVS